MVEGGDKVLVNGESRIETRNTDIDASAVTPDASISPSITTNIPVPASPTIFTTKNKEKLTIFNVARLTFIIIFFIIGCLSIVFTQFLINTSLFWSPIYKRILLNFTKTNFVILLTFVTAVCSPATLLITHDESIPKNSFQYRKNLLKSYLCDNSIIISNHQIYIDWLFLWFLAYMNDVANNVYIIMKKSLKNIPVLGYGMKNYKFIFLSRKWELDKILMLNQLANIDHYSRILEKNYYFNSLKKNWLILFPEGTNLSTDRKKKSDDWCKKIDQKLLKNCLLPRVKGLYLSTLQLSSTTKKIYDITIGYGGISKDQFAQDIYTLKKTYLYGLGPREVHLHFRCFDIDKDIPNVKFDKNLINDEKNMEKFEQWLFKTWYEKDDYLNSFYKNGNFKMENTSETYKIELKIGSYTELIRIFIIPFVFLVLCYWIKSFFY
ncbi:hypothetical protein PACTADRAFT_48496 [Pachysolen tannophilus NRRL Y-2460]|uniref:Phospholipid/glycerol acyltransferase domain-containing protein n=1 Tax=Pachysolen tannophilus NRRL Y-2460 TaxID=669874 RepID=A0A1E4TY16_PACTA|nr:hypothetical protein PACTADRAFT_48496 [Pachysolen tannophilus NRRL Y-2460]